MHSPASERNKQPILDVLDPRLPPASRVLELACGSLQHARHFVAARPDLTWQPTDIDPGALAHGASLAASGALPANVAPPQHLDACIGPWPVGPWPTGKFNAVYAANLLHISPPAVLEHLFAGAADVLAHDGQVILYGPFMLNGTHTSAGNAAFDADLRSRNPDWGIRDLATVAATAARDGFGLRERIDMPANNYLLFFSRETAARETDTHFP